MEEGGGEDEREWLEDGLFLLFEEEVWLDLLSPFLLSRPGHLQLHQKAGSGEGGRGKTKIESLMTPIFQSHAGKGAVLAPARQRGRGGSAVIGFIEVIWNFFLEAMGRNEREMSERARERGRITYPARMEKRGEREERDKGGERGSLDTG